VIGQDFIFIHINRTGGTSTTAFLKPNRGVISCSLDRSRLDFYHSPHWNSEEIKKVIGPWEYFNRFRFTVVRNPWDRMVSQHVGTHSKVLCKTGPIDRDEFNKYTIMALSPPSTWDSVMHDRLRTGCPKGCAAGTHRRSVEPCSAWVNLEEMNFIARMETLSSDMHYVFSRIEDLSGRLLTLPVFPHCGSGAFMRERDYRVYYSDETRRLVGERFASDIENFGYVYE